MLGNVLAVLSGVFFAAMTMLLRKQKDGSPLESIILGNLLAFLVGLPSMVRAPAPSSTCLLMLGLLGVVQLGVAYQLYSRAIRHVPALQVVLITVLEPILNPTWVLIAIGERPGPRALVGGVIVLGASTLRSISAIRGRDVQPVRLAPGGEAG